MDYKTLTEIPEKRTTNTKTFDRGNGKYTLIADRSPIHWEDKDGNLHNIDCSISNGIVDKTFYEAALLTDKIGYTITSRKDDTRIDVKLDKIGDTLIHYTTPTTISGNQAIWEDIDKDFDFIIEFLPRRVRCWKKLKSTAAASEVTFTVIEDNTDRELNVSNKALGYDAKGRRTVSNITTSSGINFTAERTKKELKEYTWTETFTGQIVLRNPRTRVKTLTTSGIEYPVMIDADVEVGVSAGADDGGDSYINYPTPISYFETDVGYNPVINVSLYGGLAKGEVQAFTRFDGITIPQSATIDDATLKLYGGRINGPASIKIYAFDEADANAPTAAGDLRNKTTGIASNVVTTTFTNTVDSSTPTRGEFDLYNIDVSSIVQELVNSYDYDNEAMVFFYRQPTTNTTFVKNYIYAYDWGTTKAPALVINYSEGTQYDETAADSLTLDDVATSVHTLASGIVWGEESPTGSVVPSEWSNWKQSGGGTPVTLSGTDWGYLSTAGITHVSDVYDTTNSGTWNFTLSTDDYQAGSGAGTISIRGQSTTFNWDAGTPSWQVITTTADSKEWRYIQLKVVNPEVA